VQRPEGRVVIINAQKGWRLAGIERDAKAIQRAVQAGADCFDIGLFAGPAGEKSCCAYSGSAFVVRRRESAPSSEAKIAGDQGAQQGLRPEESASAVRV